MKILLIDNYDSFAYNLVHYLEELGAAVSVIRNDEKTCDEVLNAGFDGIVLSPGPKTPNEAGICLEIIEKAPKDLPIFGVCLGHQAIGQAFGGKVLAAKAILHGKISRIAHEKTGLFEGLPPEFNVTRYHSLAVEENSLPKELRIDARTKDGEIMGLSHVSRPVFGVQFHPESIASEYGHELLQNFLNQASAYSKTRQK